MESLDVTYKKRNGLLTVPEHQIEKVNHDKCCLPLCFKTTTKTMNLFFINL